MYPDDAVCDYIYFTPISVPDLLRQTSQIGWLTFRRQMKALSKTGGGIGFDAQSTTPDNLRDPNVHSLLSYLANKNVAHYGLLNVVANHTALADMLEKGKELLQEMKALQGKDAKRKTILAVGLVDYSQPNAWDTYKTLFKKAVDSVTRMSATRAYRSEESATTLTEATSTSSLARNCKVCSKRSST
ncbi:uncharacterized protein LOC144148772 [Haemaphysalis longicornis]